MNIETLVDTYGYAAILVGTFLEGETVLVLGAVAAQLLGNIKQYESVILSAVLLAGAAVWAFHWLKHRHREMKQTR